MIIIYESDRLTATEPHRRTQCIVRSRWMQGAKKGMEILLHALLGWIGIRNWYQLEY